MFEVEVTSVTGPQRGSGMAIGTGICLHCDPKESREITFGGDHRPMYEIAMAIEQGENPTTFVPTYLVIGGGCEHNDMGEDEEG